MQSIPCYLYAEYLYFDLVNNKLHTRTIYTGDLTTVKCAELIISDILCLSFWPTMNKLLTLSRAWGYGKAAHKLNTSK